MAIKIYHNAKCSKSRQTLALLQEQNATPTVVEYLVNPPDQDELKHMLNLLGMTPRQLMRTGEKIYAELDLDNEQHSDDDLVSAMVTHPILIQRPIVIKDGKASRGRPPEKVMEML